MQVNYRLIPMVIILLMVQGLLFSAVIPDKTAFTITSHQQDYIDLNFELPSYKISTVERGGKSVSRIEIEGANYIFIDDEETVPIFSTAIAIPYMGGAQLSVESAQSSTRSGISMAFDDALSQERSSGRYSGSVYPQSNVLVSEPMILRDYRIVSINVQPFQYDQDSGALRINESMQLRLSFNSRSSINEMPMPSRISNSFERLYQSNILNWDQVRSRNQIYQQPVMLVIYGNYSDTTYLSKVNEYLAWKAQQGYKVYSASTATTGTSNTAIKTYIQNAYNNWADRPEYIVLIGDESGTIAVPTFDSYKDYNYTLLAGNDHMGDAVIGRISVTSTNEMINYMAKLLYHERDLNLDNAAHLNKMVLVGDPSSSGISTIYTNEYVYDVSSHVYPDYEYTKLYGGSPSTTAINSAINNGVAFYNYRGYIGMSGWPSTMGSIVVPNRLFHAVFITCSTGSFTGTATTESIVRHGTSTSLTGAITAIGMATSSTHTSMNNCLNVGIFHGVYPMEMRNMGEAMLNGKIYLHTVYGVSHPTQTVTFSDFCNIIGDPTALVYVGSPSPFSITAPSSVPAGGSTLDVLVRDSASQLISNAVVTLTNSSGMQVAAITDATGRVIMNYPTTTTGSMMLTVSKDGFKAYQQVITIASTGGIVYNNTVVNDDNVGFSQGNSNGIINAGETIELYVGLRNTFSSSLSVNATATLVDPYISLSTSAVNYGAISAGNVLQNLSPFVFSVAPNTPDGHQFVLTLSGSHAQGAWSVPVLLSVSSARLEMQSYTLVGAAGNIVNPGTAYPLTISLTNAGGADLSGLNANLISHDLFFEITDPVGTYGNVNQGATVTNSSNSFAVHARGQCIDGMVIPLELQLSTAAGFAQSIHFSMTIGTTTVVDPLGQDAYGYFIFDQGDTGYLQAPSYSWIGIAPSEGGAGVALALTDPGATNNEGDQVGANSITTVDLPFDFKFYGVEYDRVSISSNGFLSFGETTDSDWRNWRLPGAGGPNPMVAVFWDDLQLNAGSYVYTYYNSAQHYYVVQWHNVISGFDRITPLTFQAILYHPQYYPTHTGDGQIKLQYKLFSNIDTGSGQGYPHGNYATIGIKDHNGLVGLEYTYGNVYPTAARPLTPESALLITTRPMMPDFPYVMLEHTTIYDENENALLEPGEIADIAIMLGNMGLVNATGVFAELFSGDPFATVLQSESYYGVIPSLGTATGDTFYALQVDESCPGGHVLNLGIRISSDTASWEYALPMTVHTPALSFGDLVVSELNGNFNGILDPGENANLIITLHNDGEVPTGAGQATLSTNTPGITIHTQAFDFASIDGLGSVNLSFMVSASNSMSQGTLANFSFQAAAGAYSATSAVQLEVGAPIEVVIGNGTSSQAYPLDRYYNYSVHEAIYLASEIQATGDIKAIGYYKDSGTDTAAIESVTVYLKHTTASSLPTGNYSLAGYTQVYSGAWNNADPMGWKEILLTTMYPYDGSSNLQILIVKGHQQWISSYPRWRYTTVAGSARARQEHSDSASPTSLTATTSLPNLRLKLYSNEEVNLYPPQNLMAESSHQSVRLSWEAPFVGNPSSYRIYRNGSTLANSTALSYVDLNVVNGSTYSYYLVAMYGEDMSEATPSVNATPNIYAPTALEAFSGNQSVVLSWTAAQGRANDVVSHSKNESAISALNQENLRQISAYRIYRDGNPIADTPNTSYEDTGLINGRSYSYHVTTIYSNPAGESAASNSVSATPSFVEMVVLGTGTGYNQSNQMSPINITYKSFHGQSVYTASELNAAGITGPLYITQLGFRVGSSPNLPLPNYVVRMKHTTATNASGWDAVGLQNVYHNSSWMPTAGDWDMLTLQTPFLWNGVDNILVDTAFGLVSQWSASGTLQITSLANGIMRGYSDSVDQTNVFSGGASTSFRPNLRLALQGISTGPEIVLDTDSLDFGGVIMGDMSHQSFEITNDGDELLTGTITSPTGYTVSLTAPALRTNGRNTLPFSLPAGEALNVYVSFEPLEAVPYNGSILINSNDANNPDLSISLSGMGLIASLACPVVSVSMPNGLAVLSWNAVENAQGYYVYKASSPDGTYSLIATRSETSYTDPNPSLMAYYKVVAYHYPPARDRR